MKRTFTITVELDQIDPKGHTITVNNRTVTGSRTDLAKEFRALVRENSADPIQTTFQTYTLPLYVKQWFGGDIDMSWDVHQRHFVFTGSDRKVIIKKKHASSARTALAKHVKNEMLRQGIKDKRWGGANVT